MATPISIDSQELRHTLSAFATGITVISIIDDEGNPKGLTVNSFNSVSLDPPLILWSLAVTTPDFTAFRQASRFAVNVLAEDQIAISERFASVATDRFADIAYTLGLGDVPLLEGCVAVLECCSEIAYPGGDHVILLGRVQRLQRFARPPLIYYDGSYIGAGSILHTR